MRSQAVDIENSELFQQEMCCNTTIDALNQYMGEDQLLIYYMRVNEVKNPNEQVGGKASAKQKAGEHSQGQGDSNKQQNFHKKNKKPT